MEKYAGDSATLGFGTYLVSLSTMIFDGQRPESIQATGVMTDDGTEKFFTL